MITINNVMLDDFLTIEKIYSFYVKNTVSNFEEESPTEKELVKRWKSLPEMPFIIAKENNEIIGFAHVKPYHTRTAYRFTVENSVYIEQNHTGKGIGKLLLEHLITQCCERNIKQIIARIPVWEGSQASINLHTKCGFEQQGRLEKVGYKFNGFIDTVLMQKQLV